MSSKFDTSWFDLENYKGLKKATIEEWAKLLRDREFNFIFADYYTDLFSSNKKEDEDLLAEISAAATCIMKGDVFPLLDDVPKKARRSVYDLTMLDALELAQDRNMIRVQPDKCKQEFSEVASWSFDPYAYDLVAKVNVDLSATDEQLRRDFNFWLAEWRHDSDLSHMKIKKKLFTQADFDCWVEYGVIPYLDLLFIAKVESKKITQNQMARLIFPDEYGVDIVERIRKVTKPTAEGLINNETHRTLSAQFFTEKKLE